MSTASLSEEIEALERLLDGVRGATITRVRPSREPSAAYDEEDEDDLFGDDDDLGFDDVEEEEDDDELDEGDDELDDDED